jgi:hypothetical protein
VRSQEREQEDVQDMLQKQYYEALRAVALDPSPVNAAKARALQETLEGFNKVRGSAAGSAVTSRRSSPERSSSAILAASVSSQKVPKLDSMPSRRNKLSSWIRHVRTRLVAERYPVDLWGNALATTVPLDDEFLPVLQWFEDEVLDQGLSWGALTDGLCNALSLANLQEQAEEELQTLRQRDRESVSAYSSRARDLARTAGVNVKNQLFVRGFAKGLLPELFEKVYQALPHVRGGGN